MHRLLFSNHGVNTSIKLPKAFGTSLEAFMEILALKSSIRNNTKRKRKRKGKVHQINTYTKICEMKITPNIQKVQ